MNNNVSHLTLIPLEQYKAICFDFFDTIVVRTVHPEDVKRLVCERLSRVFNIGLSGAKLYEIRAEVERELCAASNVNGYDLEFSIVECFREMWRRLSKSTLESEERFVQLGIELELSTECAVQYADPELKAFLESLDRYNIKRCLISDFYMPSNLLRRILRFHDLDKYFDNVFVSADTMLTKRSGRQYLVVLSTLACAPSEVLMVGDNLEADYKRAREHGLNAIHLDRTEQYRQYAALNAESTDKTAINRDLDKVFGTGESTAFPEIALTLYCFTERLYESLLAKGIRDVFFLAREGQLLQRLFDVYQAHLCPDEAIRIRSHYLEVSRRSTFLPSLKPLQDEKFDTLFRQYRRISVREFLLSLGIETILPRLQVELNTDLNQRQDDLPTSKVFKELLNNKIFQETYEKTRTERRKAFQHYLNSFPLLVQTDCLCIVDVGWKGTIQDNIFNFIQNDSNSKFRKIEGFYLGLVAPGAASLENSKTGLLFSFEEEDTLHYKIFNENRALFEVILAADHGSTSGYKINENGKCEVIYNEFEEEVLFNEKIKPLQIAIELHFQSLNRVLFRYIYSPDWFLKTVAKRHSRMVFNAKDYEINWFKSTYHVENFGVFEHSTFGTERAYAKLLERIRFFLSILRRPRNLDLGFWPWLTCLERGGRLTAHFYKIYRNKTLGA